MEHIFQFTPNSRNWRLAGEQFRVEQGWLEPGTLNVAPAWYQVGQEVSHKPGTDAIILNYAAHKMSGSISVAPQTANKGMVARYDASHKPN